MEEFENLKMCQFENERMEKWNNERMTLLKSQLTNQLFKLFTLPLLPDKSG